MPFVSPRSDNARGSAGGMAAPSDRGGGLEMMDGSKPLVFVRRRGIETMPPSSSPRPSPSASVYRAHDQEATGAGQDPVPSETTPRDSLSPQRGEGRGEGCDRPNVPLAMRALDSSPRPSPRSRRRGSASWSLRWIVLPAAFLSPRPISGKPIPPPARGRTGSGAATRPRLWIGLPEWMTHSPPMNRRFWSAGSWSRCAAKKPWVGNRAFFIRTRRTIPGTLKLHESSGRVGGFPKRL
jgi:hypothetical protein